MPKKFFIPGSTNSSIDFKKLSSKADANIFCHCIKEQYIQNSDATTNPNISNAERISNILTNTYLGGRTTFGNSSALTPPLISFLGKVEGQPGGIQLPIRNRF